MTSPKGFCFKNNIYCMKKQKYGSTKIRILIKFTPSDFLSLFRLADFYFFHFLFGNECLVTKPCKSKTGKLGRYWFRRYPFHHQCMFAGIHLVDLGISSIWVFRRYRYLVDIGIFQSRYFVDIGILSILISSIYGMFWRLGPLQSPKIPLT